MADYNKAHVTKVVRLRKQGLSWTNIREALAEGKTGVKVSGSTVRRMYDQGEGRKGAYQEFYPLPGGRRPTDKDTDQIPEAEQAKIRKARKATQDASRERQTAAQRNQAESVTKAKATRKRATKVQKDTVTETVPSENGAAEAPKARRARKAVKANA